ncbi:hypothetical protein HID58_023072, partial [Brassica napus]
HQEIIRRCGNIEKLLEFHNDELRRKQQVPLFGQQELNFPIAQNLLLITINLHSSWRHLCVLDMTVFKTLRQNFKLSLIFFRLDKNRRVGDAQDPNKEKAFGKGVWNCSEPLEEQQGVCPYGTRAHGEKTKKEIKEQQTALGEAKKGFIVPSWLLPLNSAEAVASNP